MLDKNDWFRLDHHIICHLFWYFHVEKLELLTCRSHFRGMSQFEDLGYRAFQIFFEALHDYILGQNFASIIQTSWLYFKLDIFPTTWKSPQLEFICGNCASFKLTYLFDHHDIDWMPRQLPLVIHVEIITCGISILV